MTYNPDPHQSYRPAPSRLDGEDKTMMLLAHLSAPASYLLSAGSLPFLGPLLIWLLFKDKSPAVRAASAGAFNFNVTTFVVTALTWLSVILTLGIGLIWAIPILIVVFIVVVWVHVQAVMKTLDGQVYQYPFQVPILH